MRFFHVLHVSTNVDVQSSDFLTGCIILFLSTCFLAKQVLFPTIMFKADVFGVELKYCFYKSKVKISWEKVIQIKRCNYTFSTTGYRSIVARNLEAIEIFFDDSVDLGLVGDSLEHPEDNHAILVADYLFIGGFDKALENLKQLHPSAFVSEKPSLRNEAI
jgi:hypothetical protein